MSTHRRPNTLQRRSDLQKLNERKELVTTYNTISTTNRIQIFNTGHHSHCHFSTICRCFWTWIQSCTESFADFLYSCFQLISLKEYYENRFQHFVPLNINKVLSDLYRHIVKLRYVKYITWQRR